MAYHRELLEAFLKRYGVFYAQLLAYRAHPPTADRARLDEEFAKLFSTVTGYEALDERIAETKAKKHWLLRGLEHPEISLHNNPAERGARKRVRQRDARFGTRTADGTKAWDTFMTLAATAKKLDGSFHKYGYARGSDAYEMPSLAGLISGQAEQFQWGASWHPPPSACSPSICELLMCQSHHTLCANG